MCIRDSLLSLLFPGLSRCMEGQQPGQIFLLLAAGHHFIHKALFHLELCPLESGRQLLADGLLDDARACKADKLSLIHI